MDQVYDIEPTVSIIIAVYNDVDNLATAVQSALKQSLTSIECIIVDDCSTDGSRELASDLASTDSRIRVFATNTNSGGAGAPRNIGMAAARGKYLTFLDSDDFLVSTACEQLLDEAKASGAVVVLGQTRRKLLKSSREIGWHARLYLEPRVIRNISEYPDLVLDSNSVAKLYSRSWLRTEGLTFPEGSHFEDLVFTALMFSSAPSIAVIVEVVYVWQIHDDAVRLSITHQRDSVQNLRSRISAITTIFEELTARGDTDLVQRFQLKALQHDTRIYLYDIFDLKNDELARATLEILSPFLEAIPRAVFSSLLQSERLMHSAAIASDLEGVRQAVAMHRGKPTFLGDVREEGELAHWRPQVSEIRSNALAASLATFAGQAFVRIPWYEFSFDHRVSRLSRAGNRITVVGLTYDPFGKLSIADLKWSLKISERSGKKRESRYPISTYTGPDGYVGWRVEFELRGGLDLIERPRHTLRILIENVVGHNNSGLFVENKITSRKFRVGSAAMVDRLVASKVEPYVTNISTLALRPVPLTPKRLKVFGLLRPLLALRSHIYDYSNGKMSYVSRYAEKFPVKIRPKVAGLTWNRKVNSTSTGTIRANDVPIDPIVLDEWQLRDSLLPSQGESKVRLNLDPIRKLAVYVPSFDESDGPVTSCRFDLQEWVQRFGSRVDLFILSGSTARVRIPRPLSTYVFDDSHLLESDELLRAADFVVRDESSAFVVQNRKMQSFVPRSAIEPHLQEALFSSVEAALLGASVPRVVNEMREDLTSRDLLMNSRDDV